MEQQGDQEALRVGSEEAGLMRQRAAEDAQADVDARVRAARKASVRFLESLRAEACGEESLFADGVAVVDVQSLPAAAADMRLPGLAGLAAADSDAVWRHLRAGGSGGGCDVPSVGCFRSTGKTSFVSVVVQVLLRLPAVAVWLRDHAAACDPDDRSWCFVCALWRSRLSLGFGRKAKEPALVEYLGVHGELEEFRDGSSHPAVHFLDGFLDVANACEYAHGRDSEWPGLPAAKVTHVERLFGFVLEQRSGCHACGVAGAVGQRYAARRVLRVPTPRA